MPYITPSTTPSATVRRCLFIPDDPLWLAAVSGALTELIYTYNWQDIDGITAEEAAERARQMIDEYYSGECGMVGEIKIFASLVAVPSNVLLLNGDTYTQTEYPALFDVIPEDWKSGSSFTLPNMQQRTVIGCNTDDIEDSPALGSVGGETTHILTVNEIPSHTHPAPAGGNFVQVTTGGAQAIGGGTFLFNNSAQTGARGSGFAHNNMPPYLSAVWGIVAS